MKNIFCIVSLLFIFLIFEGCAVDHSDVVAGNIAGTVVNSHTGKPIAGCEVSIEGYKSVTTEESGAFLITSVRIGEVTLHLLAQGYESVSGTVKVAGGTTVKADFSMEPLPGIPSDPDDPSTPSDPSDDPDEPSVPSNPSTPPTVKTVSVLASGGSPNSVNATGSITNIGSSTVTSHGFCYAIGYEPTLEKNIGITNLGYKSEPYSFTETVDYLETDKEYYFRAYATNFYGTSYGEVMKITLQTPAVPPTLQTNSATNISMTSAILNGYLNNVSNVKIMEYGFFYGTTETPSLRKAVSSYVSPVTVPSKAFQCELTGLKESTKYYFQSYIIDANDKVIKGPVQSFTTLGMPSISLNSISVTLITNYIYDRDFRIKGSATLNPQGNTVVEAGFLFSMYDWRYIEYKDAQGKLQCEIRGNTISCDEVKHFEFVTNYYVYCRAYMVLSDGSVVYSGNPVKVSF